MKFLNKKTFKRLLIFLMCFPFLSNLLVLAISRNNTFDDTSSIPYNKVGLLLGTSPYLSNGRSNIYFNNRISACLALYKSGKISHVLISGDNGQKEYNEPKAMMDELIKGGIPKHKITLDYAGFRTLDSVIRAKEIFGLQSITIISQKFHTQRAVFLAKAKRINAVGYNTKGVQLKYGYKTLIREFFARTKAVLDIIIFKKPKFLGTQEPI